MTDRQTDRQPGKAWRQKEVHITDCIARILQRVYFEVHVVQQFNCIMSLVWLQVMIAVTAGYCWMWIMLYHATTLCYGCVCSINTMYCLVDPGTQASDHRMQRNNRRPLCPPKSKTFTSGCLSAAT